MINYMKSEHYRLLRKKRLYITSVIGLLLIAAAAMVLYRSGQQEADFPYATSSFLYSNVLNASLGILLILVIAFLFNLALTGKDMSLIKQSVSFGVSRNTIFWSKLILTLSYFLLLCAIGMFFMIGLGEGLLTSEEDSVRNFLIASLNMLPIVLSGFFMMHTLRMLKVREVNVMIILLLIYLFSGDLLRLLLRPISGLDHLYNYAPSTLLNDNLMTFMDQAVHVDYRYWIVGMIISVISLLIGLRKFASQHID